MRDFFVWLLPSAIYNIEAASEQDAAEAFLQRPATSEPVRGLAPACFVQATYGFAAPRLGDPVEEFWIKEDTLKQ